MNDRDNGIRKDLTIEDLRESAKKMETSEWRENEREKDNELRDLLLERIKDFDKKDALQIQEARKRYAITAKHIVPEFDKRTCKPTSPAKSQKKPRNAKCACGSGKKNKKCCNF